MTLESVERALTRVPRVRLATLPTPLHEAPRLREALGGSSRCPRILVKRDDLTGLALGGNKARKLEFLVADAQRRGATVLVTTGAVQSNHARTTAGAARVAGMRAELVLTADTDDPSLEGNLLLDRLFGARVHLVPAEDPSAAAGDEAAAVQRVVDDVEAHGGVAYVVPVGGSNGVGALGYVDGSVELCRQLQAMGVRPSRLYFASGSRGTQAGLTLGAQLCDAPYRVCGIAVSGGEEEKLHRAMRVAREAAELLGIETAMTDAQFVTDQRFIGDGYGIASAVGLDATLLLARSEALVLDSTYTAKAMAGLIHDVRHGVVAPEETVVFLHTGGSPALLASHAARDLERAAGWQE